jgi:hypothetical protein
MPASVLMPVLHPRHLRAQEITMEGRHSGDIPTEVEREGPALIWQSYSLGHLPGFFKCPGVQFPQYSLLRSPTALMMEPPCRCDGQGTPARVPPQWLNPALCPTHSGMLILTANSSPASRQEGPGSNGEPRLHNGETGSPTSTKAVLPRLIPQPDTWHISVWVEETS